MPHQLSVGRFLLASAVRARGGTTLLSQLQSTPLEVSDVKAIAFAPQDKMSRDLMIGQFVVSR